MSRLQIDTILKAVRAAPPPGAGATIADLREATDRQQTSYPVPSGVTFVSGSLGGVPELAAIPANDTGGKRILYLHGGGYIVGSLEGYRSLTAHLAARTNARVDSLGYRLAPEHPHPAAVEDALAAYRALIDETPPSRVALAGDSAGGGLTLALLQAVRDARFPLPAAALLISPWVDLDYEGGSRVRNAERDPMVSIAAFRMMRQAYLGGMGATPAAASPLHGKFTGLPPMMIQVGSAEILLDDALTLARLCAEADVRVQLEVHPHMFHGWHSRSATLNEADDTLASAARFLSSRLEAGFSWECEP